LYNLITGSLSCTEWSCNQSEYGNKTAWMINLANRLLAQYNFYGLVL